MNKVGLLVLALALAACASAKTDADFTRVSVAQLAAHPEEWDGRQVEIQGFIVIDFENVGLYESWHDYCHGGWGKKAIHVDWDESPSFRETNNHRMAVVQGIFHNDLSPWADEKGVMALSTGAPGPGPMEQPLVVRRLSGPFPRCSDEDAVG